MPSKPTTPKPTPIKAADPAALTAAIEKMASKPGVYKLSLGYEASSKLTTDRIRRVPRVKGLQALGVTVLGDGSYMISNRGVQAEPWPAKKAPAKKAAAKKAPAKKAPAKAKAAAQLKVLDGLMQDIVSK